MDQVSVDLDLEALDEVESLEVPTAGTDIDALSRTVLFTGLPARALQQLTWSASYRALDTREEVDCTLDGVVVVKSGGLKVLTEGGYGRRLVASVVDAGQSFASLGPEPHVLEALEPTKLLIVPARVIWRLTTEYPGLAQTLLRDLEARRRQLSRRVESLSFKRVELRVVEAVLEARRARPGADTGMVDERLNRQDLAELVGASRETVCRVLSQMQKRDYVERRGRRLHIPSVARLQRLVRSNAW